MYGYRGSPSNRQWLCKSLSEFLKAREMATLEALTQAAVVYRPLWAKTKCFGKGLLTSWTALKHTLIYKRRDTANKLLWQTKRQRSRLQHFFFLSETQWVCLRACPVYGEAFFFLQFELLILWNQQNKLSFEIVTNVEHIGSILYFLYLIDCFMA